MNIFDFEIAPEGDVINPDLGDSYIRAVTYRNEEIEVLFEKDGCQMGLLFTGIVRVKITGFGLNPNALYATISGKRVGVDIDNRILNSLLPNKSPWCSEERNDEYGESFLKCKSKLDSGEAILFGTECGSGTAEITIACKDIKGISY